MKILVVLAAVFLLSMRGSSQTLRRVSLKKEDKDSSVFQKFMYSAKDSYGIVNLTLKRDSTYFYAVNTFATHKMSEGKWRLIKDMLVLESSIQIDNVPAEVSYDKTGVFVDSFKVAIVKNVKNELLTEAFVLINNDSTKCLPMIGKCDKMFEEINKVKVVFENGMSSKWISIKDGVPKIQIIIATDIPIANYIVMHNRKFKLNGNCLIQQ